jgi:hypothetical protein
MKERIFQKLALVSALLLWSFIFFSSGVISGHVEKFQRAWDDMVSGRAGAELLPYAKDPFDKQLTVWNSVSHALGGGALLVGAPFSQGPALFLVDEEGKVLHHWQADNWLTPNAANPADTMLAVNDAQLLPDGDVIFIEDMRDGTNQHVQRLARIDRDSHVKWQLQGNFHHLFTLGGKPQKIYVLAVHETEELPIIGPKMRNVGYLGAWIEEYTLDGKKTGGWSIEEAFARSAYRDQLSTYEIDLPQEQRVAVGKKTLYDLLHVNSVQLLDAASAKALPFAASGDILLSLRGQNMVAVLRPSSGKIIWAGCGPWRHQHYVTALQDGALYIYDNEGSQQLNASAKGRPLEEIRSRVIRYNPFTNVAEEVYGSTLLHSFWQGYYFALPGKSWFIASPERSRAVVISPDKQVVWELRAVPNRDIQVIPERKQISTVRYYPKEALTFLDAKQE